MPRLKTSEDASSLVFFSHIARDYPSSAQFLSAIRLALADADRAVTEIGQQVWANSQVAAAKYNHVQKALKGLSCAVYLGFVGVIIFAIVRLVWSVTNGE